MTTKPYENEGQQRFAGYWARQMADPEFARVYEEEAAKKQLWLQLVEAREAAGLTQAELAARIGITQSQVARMEKRGYDAYSLTSPRRYVQARGDGYDLEVRVRTPAPARPRQGAHP